MNKIAGFVENLPQLSQHFSNTEVFGCQRKAAEDSRQKLAQTLSPFASRSVLRLYSAALTTTCSQETPLSK
jgi:hypothetical protein